MSYELALQAAGAEILVFESFGSYQGDWWAKVRTNGETGWINGSYGSCSGCDSFEAEFGYSDEEWCEAHRWTGRDERVGCAACVKAQEAYQAKLADFGKPYLDGLMTQEAAEKHAGQHSEWDEDGPAMVEFVRNNKATGESQ